MKSSKYILEITVKVSLLFILFLFISNSQAQLTHTFTQIAHIDEGGSAYGVALDSAVCKIIGLC